MGTIRVTVRESRQNNNTSTRNIGKEHFSYFGIIKVNPLEGFRTFRENNNSPLGNNNNNNPLLLLLLLGFGGG